MPQYKKIRARNLREAKEIALKKYGDSFSIIREEVQTPKGWRKFFHFGDSFCEIVVANYKNRKNSILDDLYIGSLKDLDDDENEKNELSRLKSSLKKLSNKKDIPQPLQRDFSAMLDKKSKQIAYNSKEINDSFEKDFSKMKDLKKVFRHSSKMVRKEEKEKFSVIEKFLLDRRFDAALANEMANICLVDNLDSTENFRHLSFTLASYFSFSEDFFQYSSTRFFFFCGTPGVGKTTTLFKVAANLSKKKNHDIFLVSYDQTRLMASAQMEKFADILEVPFRRLEGVECMKRLKDECVTGTIVLVDLGGVSLSDKVYFDECKELMNVVKDKKKVLLHLHAAMGREEISLQLKKFSSLNIDALALSHLDEVSTLGPVLSAIDCVKKPIAIFSFGQDIPYDMDWANKNVLEKQLLRLWFSRGA